MKANAGHWWVHNLSPLLDSNRNPPAVAASPIDMDPRVPSPLFGRHHWLAMLSRLCA